MGGWRRSHRRRNDARTCQRPQRRRVGISPQPAAGSGPRHRRDPHPGGVLMRADHVGIRDDPSSPSARSSHPARSTPESTPTSRPAMPARAPYPRPSDPATMIYGTPPRSGLLVGHVGRHRRDRTVLGNRHVLGMSAERASLYPNTLSPTPNDATPLPTASTTPANSVPRTGDRGLISPVRNLMKGPGSPVGAVRPVHRRRVDLDEHPDVPRSRLLHF
jgi:hypothetical protein